jgi:rod shape determining protein RodA
MITRKELAEFDWILFSAMLVLCFIGLAFVFSSAAKMEPETGIVKSAGYLKRQAQWLGVSGIALIAVVFFHYNLFRKWAYVIYSIGILALLYVPWHGTMVKGARRWIDLLGNRVQPSEFMKLAVVLALAHYLMYSRRHRTLFGLIPPFLLVLVPTGLIMIQPDLGTAMVLPPALFAMLYVAGAQLKHLLMTIGGGLACAPIMWFTIMSDFQRARITTFINLGSDPHHLQGQAFQTVQSIIAISSGGLTGKGFAQGSQNLLDLVPEASTDFIFTVIVEEMGFIGGLMVMTLFFILLSRCAEIAARTREPFARLVCVGIVTMMAFQTLINIGMTMRLCPITGVTLPFLSYGGSSLLSSVVMMSLVLSIGMRKKYVSVPVELEQ